MKYRTELMEQILTNTKAQEIIDYVSQIYGESYVGLWIYQAIGTVLGNTESLASQLRYETNPATTTLMIAYWENAYGIQPDDTMTLQQRRNRIISVIGSRGAVTPARLASAISGALGGVQVEVTERTGPNQFRVMVRGAVRSLDPARAIIDKMKPAHLTYQIVGIEQMDANITLESGAAITQGIKYRVEVE